MNILVLGASSFSGKAFADYARGCGCGVLEMSRPRFDLVHPGGLKAVSDAVEKGWYHIVNFAALNMVGESWQHAPDYYRANVAGAAALADALQGLHVSRFVQVSTPEVYGTTGQHVTEGEPFRPSTPYAVSRAAADQHLALVHKVRGFPVCFTRTVNVYGPGQQIYRIIPKTALCALTGRRLPLHGGGASARSFIHIRDVAAGVLKVLERGRPGETYHMATPRQTVIRQLVADVAALARPGLRLWDIVDEAPERPGKDMAYQLDDSKIRRELGWTDTVGLEEGLAETVGWVRDELPRLRDLSTEYRHAA